MIDEIITGVLKAEGWDTYTDHPADKGGPTKWGITLKAWQDYTGKPVTAFNMKAITESEARLFYQRKYVIEPGFNRIANPILMALLIDAGVNHGTRAATKWLQRAIGATQDGVLGPKTLQAVAQKPWDDTYCLVLSYRIRLYGYLVSRDPKLKAAKEAGFRLQAEFSEGWNARAAKWLERLAEYVTGG